MAYKTRRQNDWIFARVELSAADRKTFSSWADDPAIDLLELCAISLEEGYKLSVSRDEENDTWIATLSGTRYTTYNSNTSLSARHDSFANALALVLFKHLQVCKQGRWSEHSREETWG